MKRFPCTTPITEAFLAGGEGFALAVSYLASNGWFRDIGGWIHPRAPTAHVSTLLAVQSQARIEKAQHGESEEAELKAAGWILREDLWSDSKGIGGIWPTHAAIEIEKYRRNKQMEVRHRAAQLDRALWIRKFLNPPPEETIWRSPYTGLWVSFHEASTQQLAHVTAEQREREKAEKDKSVDTSKPFWAPTDKIEFIEKLGWFKYKDGWASPRDLEEEPLVLSSKDAFLAEYSFQQELQLEFAADFKKGLLAKGWKSAASASQDFWYDPVAVRGSCDIRARTELHWWNAAFIQQARDKGLSVRGKKSTPREVLFERLRTVGWVWLSVNGSRIPFWYHAASNRVVPEEGIEAML